MIAPPQRSPMFLMSAMFESISRRYSWWSGSGQIQSPVRRPAPTISSTSASSLPIAPEMSVPSAIMHAPVSVAVSMMQDGFLSARNARASARIRPPSASVFSTSDVVPP